ncbi:DUF4393 domain-containing protein [Leuconostoc mesenteroides]|uniref:DUF4393 domain-containing protein n=1 Tax=Leuconostoc mesenteroides TaxID=1245 RepID=UPI0021A7E446|nr:DUF4393 domain-containing protein [Leuconostoc mesenteroides]MCT3039398.1 DUF4393 domain-containing protein [Leuconostoc mesenteroides]
MMNPDDLKTLSDFVPESTKEELLNPPAHAVGQGFGGLLYWILHPLIKLGIRSQAEVEAYQKSFEEKANNIDVENYDPSKIGLAYSTLQSSADRLDNDLLRDMFAQLLTNTLDKTKNTTISPKFKSVLANMSNDEAILLNYLASNRYYQTGFPYLNFYQKNDAGGNVNTATDIIGISNGEYIQKHSEISELEIDGIIKTSTEQWFNSGELSEQYDLIKIAVNQIPEFSKDEVSKGILMFTDFGQRLVTAILP